MLGSQLVIVRGNSSAPSNIIIDTTTISGNSAVYPQLYVRSSRGVAVHFGCITTRLTVFMVTLEAPEHSFDSAVSSMAILGPLDK